MRCFSLTRWLRSSRWLKYAMEYEQLVFFTQDPSSANPANIEADDGTQYEPSIGPDVEPVEVPVSKEGGEPLAEHRPHSFFRPTPSWLPPGRSTCSRACCSWN